MVEYRILGSVEVYDGAWAVDLGGFRERTLLVRLLLSANRVVSASQLIEDLWSGRPPPHSLATLRVYIFRLRRALGPAGESLVTYGPGYRLDIADGELDATRFEQLAKRARAELAAGDPELAAASLRQALDLWRGPALSDAVDLEFARADAVRLEEARLTALEDRIDADLACGHHTVVISELDGLVASHPLRERLWGQRILAMYRCGRQAAALEAYQELRVKLAEELGVDPTPELRRLHQAVLRQEPRLEWRPPACGFAVPRPVPPGDQPSRGADDRPGLVTRHPAPGRAAARQPLPGQAPSGRPWLPTETTSFIGREDELTKIGELLGQSRLITLTGPGGSGKSRLALRAGAELFGRYSDGAWLIQLAPVAKPELLLPAVATALLVREEPGTPLLDSIIAQFRPREALLILDNCEHLLGPVADVAAALLSGCPAVRVIATSQSRLRAGGEVTWPVPPLSVPAPQARELRTVLAAESVQLFCDRAAQARLGFALTGDNAAAVSEICRRLDGIPLAVELAAARVSALTPGQISARFDDRFRLLTGGSRTGLPRHQTLYAALEWSHDLLNATEQVCFRRMAVFAGGCTIDAVEAVCPDALLPPAAVVEAVSSLVDRSLLTTEERLGSIRYGMLESIRQYASQRLDEAGERAEFSGRHLGWLLEEAGRADLDGPDQGAWLDLLAAEHDNFVAGLEWSLSLPAGAHTPPSDDKPRSDRTPAAEAALTLAAALAPFWKVRGYTGLGQRWLDAALAVAGPGADARLLAAALDGAGQLAAVRADDHAQRVYQDESLAIWRSLGEDAKTASTLGDLGSAAHTRADYPAAQAMHEQALVLARRAGDALQMARSLSGLGVLALHQGDLPRATGYFEEARARFGEVGDLRRATLILGNLGVVALNQGDFSLARTRFEEHLSNTRRLGDRKLMAGALTNLGMTVHHLGDVDRAERLHAEALELTEQIGDRRIGAVALTNLGLVAYSRKDFPAAVSFHRRSLALARAVGEPRSIAESLEELAQAESALGNMRRAAGLFGASQAIRDEIGAPIPGPDLMRYNEALAATELALGSDQFALARDVGRALSVAAAVDFAQGGATASGPSGPRAVRPEPGPLPGQPAPRQCDE